MTTTTPTKAAKATKRANAKPDVNIRAMTFGVGEHRATLNMAVDAEGVARLAEPSDAETWVGLVAELSDAADRWDAEAKILRNAVRRIERIDDNADELALALLTPVIDKITEVCDGENPYRLAFAETVKAGARSTGHWLSNGSNTSRITAAGIVQAIQHSDDGGSVASMYADYRVID